jgi:diguanylate cyclase (GGDEF)-like protein
VKLRKLKKSQARKLRADLADAASAGHAPSELDRIDPADRAEIAEAMYRAALTRSRLALATEQAAEERLAGLEAREQAAAERAVEAARREQIAEARLLTAEASERVATDRAAAAEAVQRAARERAAAVEAREQALAEREALAIQRDRVALERDTLANARDKAAVERDATLTARLTAGRGSVTDAGDGEFELERARLEAELQRAHLDALTGAFRREVGRLALRNEIDRARRGDGRFVMAFIDVDGLKGVNDRDGHAAGDRILRMLAATMRANLRSYDPIVRYGGDEFLCGIASIDQGEVQHRIGVIDQSLRRATGVGISAGLATLTGSESLEELTAKADAALLEAKRNRGDED